MANADQLLVDFSRGELTPKLNGRVDLPLYNQGLSQSINYMPVPFGGINKRPGTWRIDDLTADEITDPIMIPFANDNSDYDQLVIVWQDAANYIQVLFYAYNVTEFSRTVSRGPSNQLLNTFPGVVGSKSKYTRINDKIYFASENVQPFTLTRNSNGLFSIAWTTYAVPAFDPNRFYVGGDIIAGYAAKANVSDTPNIGQTPPSSAFWTAYSGASAPDFYVNAKLESNPEAEAPWYPKAVTSRMGRLIYGGSAKEPTSMWGSMTREYGMFVPGLSDSSAWKHTLTSNDLGAIHWLVSGSELVAGTDSGEFVIGGGELGITPTNIQVRNVTENGSGPLQPLLLGDQIIFTQSDGRQLKGYAYSDPIGSFKATHINATGDHVWKYGLKSMALTRSPRAAILGIGTHGQIIRFGYDKDYNELSFFPWYNWEDAGMPASIEHGYYLTQGFLGVASMPAKGLSEDVVFVINHYNLYGAETYLEIFHWSDYHNNTDAPITGQISKMNYGLGTDSSTGAQVQEDADGFFCNGLETYEGRWIAIAVDGAVHPMQQVIDGEIRLEHGGDYAVVGLELWCDGVTMDLGPIMRTKRVHQMGVRFLNTVGAEIGTSPDNLETVIFRDGESYYDTTIPLYSGDKIVDNPGGFGRETKIYFSSHEPGPQTILAIVAWMKGSSK